MEERTGWHEKCGSLRSHGPEGEGPHRHDSPCRNAGMPTVRKRHEGELAADNGIGLNPDR